MRSALSERLCTPQPGSRGRDGGRFEVCGRYLLSVEALRRWADSETDRSPQLHELRVSCWLDLTRSAARWREPAAACLAGHNYAALASYTPAVYSTPSMYSDLAGFELNSMKVAPYTDCARTCKSPSLQLGSSEQMVCEQTCPDTLSPKVHCEIGPVRAPVHPSTRF